MTINLSEDDICELIYEGLRARHLVPSEDEGIEFYVGGTRTEKELSCALHGTVLRPHIDKEIDK